MTAYYNENDPHAAQWLRNLISRGLIAPGEVDERSIEDVTQNDLHGFTQCHFFAGIGVWSYALRAAGWPDSREVWTGSCPCQSFSTAGKGEGFADERHLWPAWFHLINQRRPRRIYGEQVASKDGLKWLDLVHDDMEASSYTVRAFDLCAAGVGAPHIRQRLFFVADADNGDTAHSGVARGQESARREHGLNAHRRGDALRMADAESLGLLGRPDDSDGRRRERASGQGCEAGGLGEPYWFLTKDGDATCLSLYERHYSAYKYKDNRVRKLFAGPGEKIVLRTARGDAMFVWRKFRDDSGQTGINCAVFRNESRIRSSDLIRQADAIADYVWPGERHYTYVCAKAVRSNNPGYCFKVAGWRACGITKRRGLVILERDGVAQGDAIGGGHGDDGHQPGRLDALADGSASEAGAPDRPGPTNGHWRDADWLGCTDGKWRPVEPGTQPLVDGTAFRVGSGGPYENKSRAKMLKGYGNAIVAPLAAEFISITMDVLDHRTIDA